VVELLWRAFGEKNFSRKGAKAQRKLFGNAVALRLCVFAGDIKTLRSWLVPKYIR